MKSNKGIWKWLIITLALMNIALMVTIWLAPQHPDRGPRGGPSDFIIHELHLTASQTNRFILLRDDHRRQMNRLNEKGKELRDNFFIRLKDAKADTVTINHLSDEIANNQRVIELVTFEHFKKVRLLCDTRQKKLFDNIIDEVLQQMGPKQHP